ncbi:hypothetical protein VNO77_22910 [Canavalia gladiata]|uniref:SAM-dependent MTase RsmB/NOP-type domain-containing protein n=1 Tax=Canavalia gladiata TaxID=3824 RepID=A0AAN9QEX2_CANGL
MFYQALEIAMLGSKSGGSTQKNKKRKPISLEHQDFPHRHITESSSHQIYGIDAFSGAAVMALNIPPGDHVLDMYAGPSAKLCMILDLLGCSGFVTKVDVARHH